MNSNRPATAAQQTRLDTRDKAGRFTSYLPLESSQSLRLGSGSVDVLASRLEPHPDGDRWIQGSITGGADVGVYVDRADVGEEISGVFFDASVIEGDERRDDDGSALLITNSKLHGCEIQGTADIAHCELNGVSFKATEPIDVSRSRVDWCNAEDVVVMDQCFCFDSKFTRKPMSVNDSSLQCGEYLLDDVHSGWVRNATVTGLARAIETRFEGVEFTPGAVIGGIEGGELKKVQALRCNFRHSIDLPGERVDGEFDGSIMEGINLRAKVWAGSYKSVSWRGSRIEGAVVGMCDRADVRGADLSGASFARARITPGFPMVYDDETIFAPGTGPGADDAHLWVHERSAQYGA